MDAAGLLSTKAVLLRLCGETTAGDGISCNPLFKLDCVDDARFASMIRVDGNIPQNFARLESSRQAASLRQLRPTMISMAMS